MRKIAATALALPIVAIILMSSLFRRPGFLRISVMAGAVGVLVVGLLFGLPARDVSGQPLPTFAPLAPQADIKRGDTNLALDAPFQLQFTKPMNESTVESAVVVTPSVPLQFQWDATGQILSVLPESHWTPYTTYHVVVSTSATDQAGLGLAAPINTSFQSGSTTGGTIVATQMVNDMASPGTAFQITFTRPVKLATVLLGYGISPHVPVDVVGDDPTDAASQVFTMTPKDTLASDTDYTVSMADGGSDTSGSPLSAVKPLTIHTLQGPAVVRFRPQDGGVTYDTTPPISVRFTVPMDRKSTAAAFSVAVNGKGISGSVSWAEGDTVLVFTVRKALPIGSTVVAKVTTNARSVGGVRLGSTSTSTFKVSRPTSRAIAYTGGVATATSPWKASEVYYMALMNCTRTGGWVTRSGSCSTQTHHTLPAQGRLTLDAGISNKVARPYAKFMADRKILDHYAYHDPHWRLCNWGGYCGGSWGENIASPSSYGPAGMIAIEIFYQNEYWCRCEHYYNIMDPYFRRAGVGVWVSKSVRVSIDFYG